MVFAARAYTGPHATFSRLWQTLPGLFQISRTSFRFLPGTVELARQSTYSPLLEPSLNIQMPVISGGSIGVTGIGSKSDSGTQARVVMYT